MNFDIDLKSFSSKLAVGTILAGLVTAIVKGIKEGNAPIETEYEVKTREWTRTVTVAKKTLAKESGWEAPSGAHITDTRWEFKEMEKVPSGVDKDGFTTYKEVPKYATKYYYDIYKWIDDRRATSRGYEQYAGSTMTCPYYPDVTLDADEKISNRSSSYNAVFYNVETGELKSFPLSENIWNSICVGCRVVITTTKWAPNTIKNIRLV